MATSAMAANQISDRGKDFLPKASYFELNGTFCLGIEIVLRNPSGNMVNKAPVICVFCGSSYGENLNHAAAARELGTLIGARGFSLVFGGGNVGLMGEVARAVSANGGTVVGVLPSFLRHLEPPLKTMEELIITPDMQQRKARMLSLSDAFVALPGGLGTLDEIFEVLSTAQLKVHAKPIALLNIDGHFDALQSVLAGVVREGFAQASIDTLYRVTKSPHETIEFLEGALGTRR
jgi:uncharacterized protein (TIGR00730 family)